MVVDEEVIGLLLSKFFKRIGPQDVAHKAMRRWFAEAVDLIQSVTVLCVFSGSHTLFRSSSV